MTEEELRKGLEVILEKGFDQFFVEYCAATFSSYTYPDGNLAAARMHALALRAYLMHYMEGMPLENSIPLFMVDTCRVVGVATMTSVIERPNANAESFCKDYISGFLCYLSKYKLQ